MKKSTLIKVLILIIFGIAFAYIESAVVVYLRAIFYPDGFSFPLTEFGMQISPLWKRLILTEIGREAATLVLILTGAWLVFEKTANRWAAFLIIFAVWDIFYYVWLKVLLDWPATIMDWDILFMIPMVWASPVIAPMMVSLMMFIFALLILNISDRDKEFRVSFLSWIGFSLSAMVIVLSFCLAGLHIKAPDYRQHFSWPIFLLGMILAIRFFIRCYIRSNRFE